MAITNGSYRAKACGEVVLGTSAQKGTPFIEVYFEITSGENVGGKVRWTSYFSEKTSERTIESLTFCGWSGEDLGEFADGKLHGLDSKEVEIVVALEEYQDTKSGELRTSPKVQWVNRAGGYLNVANAMNMDAAKSFGERMRGLVIAAKEKMGTVDFKFGANSNPPPSTQQAPVTQQPGKKAF